MTLRPRRLSTVLITLTACMLVMAAFAFAQGNDEASYLPPSLGEPDAPVTIVEYSDFQCPNCTLFAREIMPQIIEAYIKTGKVRFEFRHFPWMSAASFTAAHASTCAHQQGKFWEYHDHLFSPGRGALSEAALIGYAEMLGLDQEAFAACLADDAGRRIVEEDYTSARRNLLVATPTFYINGRQLTGPRPFQVFEILIDATLAEVGQ